MLADVANEATACSASCGSNAGVPERQAFRKLDLPDHERAAGQIEGHLDERLVEWVEAAGEAADARLVAERLHERPGRGDGDVFDRVMCIDVQIASCRDAQVEATMLADLVEHVVVERDAGGDLVSRLHPSSSIVRSIEVSLVVRSDRRRPAHCTISVIAVEELVVLVGGADGDSQAVGEPWPAGAIADQDAAVEQVLPHLPTRSVARPEEDEVGAAGEDIDGQARPGLPRCARARRRSAFTRASISSVNCSASRPAICLAVSR